MSGNSSVLSGGCFCGRVRYQAEGPRSHETNCHCSICRRTTGAPFVAWLTVQRHGFRFVRGAPTRFRSSETGTREFCGHCGTQLTFRSKQVEHEIDITLGSLDDPNLAPPRDHTWVSSKLDWIQPSDGMPTYPKQRPH